MRNDESCSLNSSLSQEMKLLLLCSFNEISPEQQKQIHELAHAPINWMLFLDLVIKNRVYPFVYKNLAKINDSSIDPQVLTVLEEKCRKNVTDSFRLTAELVRVMGLFDENGIKAISLKGPVLGMLLYGDVSKRISKDLDILVNLSDLEKAGDILMKAGYEKENVLDNLTARQTDYFMKSEIHLNFTSKSGIHIELHWRHFTYTNNYSFETVWENRTEFAVSGKKINTLCKEENFLFLIYHGSWHAWKRLRWLCDVRDMIEKVDLDWEYIARKSEKLGISHILDQTLILLKELFGTEPPKTILLKRKNNTIANRLAVMTMLSLNCTDEKEEFYGHPLYAYRFKYSFLWHRKLAAKVRYILRTSFSPRMYDFQWVKFKDRYFFMYYLIHPFYRIIRMFKLGK